MAVMSMAASMSYPVVHPVRKQMMRPFQRVNAFQRRSTFQRVPAMPATNAQQRNHREKHSPNQAPPIDLEHTDQSVVMKTCLFFRMKQKISN